MWFFCSWQHFKIDTIPERNIQSAFLQNVFWVFINNKLYSFAGKAETKIIESFGVERNERWNHHCFWWLAKRTRLKNLNLYAETNKKIVKVVQGNKSRELSKRCWSFLAGCFLSRHQIPPKCFDFKMCKLTIKTSTQPGSKFFKVENVHRCWREIGRNKIENYQKWNENK